MSVGVDRLVTRRFPGETHRVKQGDPLPSEIAGLPIGPGCQTALAGFAGTSLWTACSRLGSFH